MTVWSRPECEVCRCGIGTDHFALRPRTPKLGWTSFVSCAICLAKRCRDCAEGDECPRCGDAWLVDELPPVWRNLLTPIRPWPRCVSCDAVTRPEESGYRPDPKLAPRARWYSCDECSLEFCETCARARRKRCACLETLVFRGRPRARAYLSHDFRERLRKHTPAVQEKILRREIDDLLRTWKRGGLSDYEISWMPDPYERVLREEFGVALDTTRWKRAWSPKDAASGSED